LGLGQIDHGHMGERIYNEKTLFSLLKIMGVGIVVLIGYVALESYFTNKEYPMLTSMDSLDGEQISSFKTNRGIALVEFVGGRKHKIDWGQNLNYDEFPTIVEVLHIGDLVFKKSDSDSISFRHLDKEYYYVLGHMIKRNE
jgi:hypothetical protein